jgi:hypothetical protein
MAESAAGSGAASAPKAQSSRFLPAVNDKREHPRFKVEGAVATLGKPGFLASLGLGSSHSPVVNLSKGGAMIQVHKLLPAESVHPLRIEIPKYNEVIETQAEIRWGGQSARKEKLFFVGVAFKGMSSLDLKKIGHLYEVLSSAEYRAMSAVRKDASSAFIKIQKP